MSTEEPAPVGSQHPRLVRPDGAAPRVLVVDDEQSLAEVLGSVLRREGWTARTAYTGLDAVRIAREFVPDAVILDVMLPDLDAVEDRIAGITAGGDDYVTKPFSLEEVLARLRGLLRRSGIGRTADRPGLTVGDLTLDEDAHEVHRGADRIELTATEYELLRFFMRNPRRVLSKAQILDRVWAYDFGGE